jgi:hypothetical protein
VAQGQRSRLGGMPSLRKQVRARPILRRAQTGFGGRPSADAVTEELRNLAQQARGRETGNGPALLWSRKGLQMSVQTSAASGSWQPETHPSGWD